MKWRLGGRGEGAREQLSAGQVEAGGAEDRAGNGGWSVVCQLRSPHAIWSCHMKSCQGADLRPHQHSKGALLSLRVSRGVSHGGFVLAEMYVNL